jgi:hypothetical protein
VRAHATVQVLFRECERGPAGRREGGRQQWVREPAPSNSPFRIYFRT